MLKKSTLAAFLTAVAAMSFASQVFASMPEVEVSTRPGRYAADPRLLATQQSEELDDEFNAQEDSETAAGTEANAN